MIRWFKTGQSYNQCRKRLTKGFDTSFVTRKFMFLCRITFNVAKIMQIRHSHEWWRIIFHRKIMRWIKNLFMHAFWRKTFIVVELIAFQEYLYICYYLQTRNRCQYRYIYYDQLLHYLRKRESLTFEKRRIKSVNANYTKLSNSFRKISQNGK